MNRVGVGSVTIECALHVFPFTPADSDVTVFQRESPVFEGILERFGIFSYKN